jgi:hypothetical protein
MNSLISPLKSYDNLDIKRFEYNESNTYYLRLYNILNTITDDYIILNNDNDILIDYVNIDKLNETIEYMKDNNIDQIRVSNSGIYNKPDNTNDDLNIYKIKNGYFMSVQCGIWKRISLLKIVSKFRNHPYNCGECYEIQNYVENNLNNYFMFKYTDLLDACDGQYIGIFPALHIITGGKWMAGGKLNRDELIKITDEFNIDYNIRGYA